MLRYPDTEIGRWVSDPAVPGVLPITFRDHSGLLAAGATTPLQQTDRWAGGTKTCIRADDQCMVGVVCTGRTNSYLGGLAAEILAPRLFEWLWDFRYLKPPDENEFKDYLNSLSPLITLGLEQQVAQLLNSQPAARDIGDMDRLHKAGAQVYAGALLICADYAAQIYLLGPLSGWFYHGWAGKTGSATPVQGSATLVEGEKHAWWNSNGPIEGRLVAQSDAQAQGGTVFSPRIPQDWGKKPGGLFRDEQIQATLSAVPGDASAGYVAYLRDTTTLVQVDPFALQLEIPPQRTGRKTGPLPTLSALLGQSQAAPATTGAPPAPPPAAAPTTPNLPITPPNRPPTTAPGTGTSVYDPRPPLGGGNYQQGQGQAQVRTNVLPAGARKPALLQIQERVKARPLLLIPIVSLLLIGVTLLVLGLRSLLGSSQQCFNNSVCIQGKFLDLWHTFGGHDDQQAGLLGLPLENAHPDQDGHLTQTFQYYQLQEDPTIQPFGVQLAALGRQIARKDGIVYPQVAQRADCDFFPNTGYNLCEPFRTEWKATASKYLSATITDTTKAAVFLFGYPISEQITDTNGGTVQWFERARMEQRFGPNSPIAYTMLGTAISPTVALTATTTPTPEVATATATEQTAAPPTDTIIAQVINTATTVIEQPTATPAPTICFDSGYCVNTYFEAVWRRYGGVGPGQTGLLGEPLENERLYMDNDKERMAQTFENLMAVQVQEAAPPWDVQFAPLGTIMFKATKQIDTPDPNTNRLTCTLITATNHNLCERFLAYWHTVGADYPRGDEPGDVVSTRTFGNPISEQKLHPETNITMQWFEKARMEFDQSVTPPQMKLGRLGAEYLTFLKGDMPSGQPTAAPASSTGTPEPPTATAIPAVQQCRQHVVQQLNPSQTLTQIVAIYFPDVHDADEIEKIITQIVKLNNIQNRNQLYVGQVLTLPPCDR